MRKSHFSGAVLALSVAFCSAQLAQAETPNASTSVQRADCGSGGLSKYDSVPGADGFGPTNLVVTARIAGTGAVRNRAGYVIRVTSPLAPAAPAGFNSIKIIFGQKGLSGDAVKAGKCRFTFTKSDSSTVVLTRSWSGMRPTAPADWRSITATAADFPELNPFQQHVLTRVVCFIDNEPPSDGSQPVNNCAVRLGAYEVDYGDNGHYDCSSVNYNSANCAAFN